MCVCVCVKDRVPLSVYLCFCGDGKKREKVVFQVYHENPVEIATNGNKNCTYLGYLG